MPGQHHAPSVSHPLTSHVCTCREKGAVSSISTALPPARPSPAAVFTRFEPEFGSAPSLFPFPHGHLLTLPYFDCKPQYTFNIYHRVTLWIGTKNLRNFFSTKTAPRTTLVDALVACQRWFLPGQVALTRSKWNPFLHFPPWYKGKICGILQKGFKYGNAYWTEMRVLNLMY